MRIGIEAPQIFQRNKHGIDHAALQLIRQLREIDKQNEYFIFTKPGDDECITSTERSKIVKVDCPTHVLWEQVALPMKVRKYGLDVLHCTANTGPLVGSVPMVLTLHDIIFLEDREMKKGSTYQDLGWNYHRRVVPRVIKRAQKVITVSKFEFQNIVNVTGVSAEKMAMIYNGYNEWFQPIDNSLNISKKYIGEAGYFFFLGNTDRKKNTERTLTAYAKYLEKSEVKRQLLVADLSREVFDEIVSRNRLDRIRDHVVLPGYIENSELPHIYHDAFAFLYPSLRESFGIPILESMACGTPVVTSNTSSMPEVAGERAMLVDPRNPTEIAETMLRLERDEQLYAEQRAYGLERAKQFSWRKMAEQVLQVYEEVGRG